MSKYSIESFTEESFGATKSVWSTMVDADAFEVELGPFFEWAGTHISPKDNDSMAWALVSNDTKAVDAIVEVVESRGGQMHKMLKVVPSPAYWDVTNKRDELIQLYIETFFQIISKAGFKSSRKIKIYGRTDEMMSLLKSLHAIWSIPGSKADFEGRFLAITWS